MKQPLTKLRRRLAGFFFHPADPRPIALLRISLGIMMMVEAVLLYPSLNDLFGPHGFLDATLMRAVSGRNLPAYAGAIEGWGISYLSVLWGFYWVRWLALVAFTLGFCTLPATIVVWLTQICLMASGALSNYGLDRYFHVFLFLLLFSPAGHPFSLDNLRRGRRPLPSARARFSLRLLQLTLLLTYFNAGIAKGLGAGWWNGDVIWRVLNMPEFRRADFWWLSDHPWLPKVMGWCTVFFETLYIAGVWIPYVGALWVLAILGMHLGIATFMGLVNFGIGMMLFNASLLLYPKARRWFQRTTPRRWLVGAVGALFPGVTARWAERIFRRTQRYPKPTWEKELSGKGRAVDLPSGNRAYRFGEAGPTVLLVHGWSGRGTQLGHFVEPLLAEGFSVVALDAPGHGESPGRSTNLGEFERAVREAGAVFGPLHGVVAHSFGGVASVVAASRGLAVERFVLLAVPCTIQETFEKFGSELGLPARAFHRFQSLAEARAGYRAADVHLGRLGFTTGRPALVVHDPEDTVVPLAQAEALVWAWSGARLHLVKGLGHRRLLKDATVIAEVLRFLKA